jgi:uncharacterized glyoxalase superfamily protein PhnB
MKLGYCIYYVESVGDTLRFFEAAFGQKIRFLHESGSYGELDTGETILAFASHEMGDANLNGEYHRVGQDNRPLGMEIAFVTNDVNAAFSTAINAGAIPVATPNAKPWGQLVGYVKTNEGILVEICSPIGG